MTARERQSLLLTEGQRRHLDGSLSQLHREVEAAVNWLRQEPLPGEGGHLAIPALKAIQRKINEMAGHSANEAYSTPFLPAVSSKSKSGYKK